MAKNPFSCYLEYLPYQRQWKSLARHHKGRWIVSRCFPRIPSDAAILPDHAPQSLPQTLIAGRFLIAFYRKYSDFASMRTASIVDYLGERELGLEYGIVVVGLDP